MQPNPGKLLMIFPSTLRGGVEEYNLTVSKGAAKQGWEVHAAFPKTDGTALLIQDFRNSDITYHGLAIAENKTWLPGSARHFPRLLKTLQLLLRLKPDVVQITLPAPDHCFGSILACGLLNIPTVVRFGLVPPLEGSINPWRIKLYNWARKRQQQWIVISKNNRRLLSQRFKIPENNITCIYNGARTDKSLFVSAEKKHESRQQLLRELNLPDTARLLITVGRLNFQKGHQDLIPAIPHIVRDFPDTRFVWVGDGELRPELEAQLRAYNVADRVVLLGYRTDVPQLLQAADLFVFPTHFEGGQSFAIAEAMAAGLPIVTSDASGIPEVIHHQVHGLVFRTGDSCELLESIRWALGQPDAMQTMAENAYQRAQGFTEETMLQNYMDVWQRLDSPRLAQSSLALHTDRA